MAAGDYANKLIIRNLNTGDTVHSFDHEGAVRCCAMQGSLVAAGDHTNKVIIRNLNTGDTVHSFDHDDLVVCCAIQGDLVAAGDNAKKLIIRDPTLTEVLDPLPGEIPLRSVLSQVSRRPHLLHRRGSRPRLLHRRGSVHPDGEAATQSTLLHRLASDPDVSAPDLEAVLAAVIEHNTDRPQQHQFVLVPVPDGNKETPLDLAMRAGNHAKCKALCESYSRSASRAWRVTSTTLSNLVTSACERHPDLVAILLDAAYLDGPVQKRRGGRLPRATLPRYRPHHTFYGVDWSDEMKEIPVGSTGVEVTVHVAGMCGLLALDGPFNAITRTQNLKAFETRAMVAAVEYKWQVYGRWYHLCQLLLFLAGLVLFCGAQISIVLGEFGLRNWGEAYPKQVHTGSTASGLMAAALIAITVQMADELAQMVALVADEGLASGLLRHLSASSDSSSTVLKLLCHVLMLSAAAMIVSADEGDNPLPVQVAALCGCADVAATFALLSLLRPYRLFGPLIRMVLEIFRDIYPFLVLMAICIVGFAMAFAIMLPEQPRFQFPTGLLTAYEMMLGVWDPDQFTDYKTGDIDRLAVLSVITFVLYTVFVLIVAMNLLIAIMGDSYDRVRESQTVHGRLQRAEALVAMDWLVRRVGRRESCFPPYFLHVLAAADEDENEVADNDWGGRLKQLKRTINAIPSEIEQRLVTKADLTAESARGMATMKPDMAKMEAKMEAKFDETRALLMQLSQQRNWFPETTVTL